MGTQTSATLPSPCPLPLELESEARYSRTWLTLLYTKKTVMPTRARASRAPITIPISWARSKTEHPSARRPKSPSPPWPQRSSLERKGPRTPGPPATRKHWRCLPWWTVSAAPATAGPRIVGRNPNRSQPRAEHCGQEGPTQAWPRLHRAARTELLAREGAGSPGRSDLLGC